MRTFTLYLIRHGETDWNVSGRFQGQIDVPLNDKGRAQARDAAAKLREESIDAFLSSDLARARETAELIRTLHPNPSAALLQDAGLREAHLGQANGLTYDEIEQKFGSDRLERWRSYDVAHFDAQYPDGESGHDVLARAERAIARAVATHPKLQSLAVISHGGVMRRILSAACPTPPEPRSISTHNTATYKLLARLNPSSEQRPLSLLDFHPMKSLVF